MSDAFLDSCLMQSLDAPQLRAVLTAIHDLEPESFLVGGVIRDALLGRFRGPDVDVAVKADGYQVARTIAAAGPGLTFVPLDPKHGTGRLVVKKPHGATIDISSFKGRDIVEDLWRRDFTINAMAVKIDDFLAAGLSPIVDPTGGLPDVNARVVKACSSEAFRDDPLRILRTFRFQAVLGFEVAPQTLDLIPLSVSALPAIAGERVREEVIAILTTARAHGALTSMDRHGVLDILFPELTPMKGAEQNVYHHLDVWRHTLETVRELEVLLDNRSAYFGEFGPQVESYSEQELVQGRPLKALLKLAAVFHDAGKPHCMKRDPDGRIRFFGHEKASRDIFEAAVERTKLATREVRMIGEWIEGHMRLMIPDGETVSRRALMRIRRRFGSHAIGLMVLFLADLAASRGPARPPEAFTHAFRQVCVALEFLLASPEPPPRPLLNGTDLIHVLGIAPGPFLGALLARLRELQDTGEITTPEQAVTAARQFLEDTRDGEVARPS